MAAHRVHAAAWPADVAQQQLQRGRGPDHLHPDRVLRPSERVHDGAHPLRVPGRGDDIRHLEERFLWRSADPFDNLRRVSLDVPGNKIDDGGGVLIGY